MPGILANWIAVTFTIPCRRNCVWMCVFALSALHFGDLVIALYTFARYDSKVLSASLQSLDFKDDC